MEDRVWWEAIAAEQKELRLLLERVLSQQAQLAAALGVTFSPFSEADRPDLFPPESEGIAPWLEDGALRSALDAGDWRSADRESVVLLLRSVGRETPGYLSEGDWARLPAVALDHLDQLWSAASGGRFGLRVQRDLYHQLGGNAFFPREAWIALGETVGWWRGDRWCTYGELDFSEMAPPGHLPVLGDGQIWFIGGWEGCDRGFGQMMAKLAI